MCGDSSAEMLTLIGGLCCVGFINPIGVVGGPPDDGNNPVSETPFFLINGDVMCFP
jgi:hypothetical protein